MGLAVVFVLALLLPRDGVIMSHFPYGKTLALAVFLLAGVTDWLDGALARHYNQETNFGALLDPVADKILTTAAFICFIEQKARTGVADSPVLVQAWMVLVIVARDFLVTGLRLVASDQGVLLKAEKLGKHKTFSQMATIIFTLGGLAIRDDWGYGGAAFDAQFSRLVFLFMIITLVLTVWSGLAYVWKNRELLLRNA
jgi:CDP-diacylglycerol--glycerol-3-phosphate 3-phosphatidyltransferase